MARRRSRPRFGRRGGGGRRRRAGRRRFSRRGRSGKVTRRSIMYKGMPGRVMPNFFRTKLYWSITRNFDSSGGAPYRSDNFIMTALNDPGGSLTSSRPPWYADFNSFYGRWVVTACAIRVSAVSTSDTTGIGDNLFGVFPASSTAQAGNVNDIESAILQPDVKYRQLTRYGNGGSKTVRSYASVRKLVGKRDVIDSDLAEGNFTTDPLIAPCFTVFAGTIATGSNVAVAYVARLTYYVTFYRLDNKDVNA